jgi:2-polyprenyl-3-methyl-5-hydroxy-6-metoxy-1,4-benzoquinol methylase
MNQWDERFSAEEYVYGTKPNAFLKEQLPLLNPGTILFACEGEGRNAVFAASLGWSVSAFDGSIKGREKALRLADQNGVSIDYRIGDATEIEYTAESFDCIVFIYAHFPVDIRTFIHRRSLQWLKPGGTIIMEAFNPAQIPNSSGGPKDITMLYTPAMLMEDFIDLSDLSVSMETVILDEGPLHQGMAEVIRMIGKK